MIKIGFTTLIYNYGSILQCYAKKLLFERKTLGVIISIILTTPQNHFIMVRGTKTQITLTNQRTIL